MNIFRLLLIAVTLASISHASHAKDCRKTNLVNFHRGFSNIKIPPSANPVMLSNASDELRVVGKKIEFYSPTQRKNSNIDDYVDKNCVNAMVVFQSFNAATNDFWLVG